MQYKPTQQQAIDHLGSNVIVPASAGAGKTAVLIARLMKRILVDEVELDQIVAMTFTEAAASEMKVRLMKALNEKYAETPTPFITKQMSLLETAHISTIHSFCLNIVKNYGYIIGIDPEQTQNIMPPTELTILRNNLIQKIVDDFVIQSPEEAKDLLNTFNSNPLNFSGLESAILQVADWIAAQARPEQSIEEMLQNYEITTLDDLTPIYKKYFFHYYSHEMGRILEAITETYDVADRALQENPDDKKQELIDQISTKHLQIIAIKRQIEQQDVSFYDAIPDALDIMLPSFQKNEDYKKSSGELEKLIKSMMKRHQKSDVIISQLNSQSHLVKTLIKLSNTFLSELKTLKRDLKVLDFSDFEPMALAILEAENGAIAQLLQNQFKEIMVDEFQDTNSYQDEIIRLISNGENIFRVGDVKQAIYGFRGGKPAIMQSIISNKEADMIPISYNFRSKYDIVNFNNITFENIMSLTINTKYTPQDIVDIGIPSQKEDSCKVEFHVIETSDDLQDPSEAEDMHEDYEEEIAEDSGMKVNLDPANTISARYIAQEIIKITQSGDYSFRDITILVHAHHLKEQLKEAFDEVNIPYFLNEQSGFYRSDVVSATIHILKYMILSNDHYLTKILMSPFFNLSMDEITLLKLNDTSMIQSLEIKYKPIYDQLNQLRYNASRDDIVSIIQNIILLNDAYNQSFSIQDKTNMDALLDKAVEYQANNSLTITGFIDYLESLIDEKSSEASPIASDEDVVTAMTIHQSKGLQFPVVFLFGLGNHRSREARDFLVCDDDMGIVMNHIELQYRFTQQTFLRKIMAYKRNHEAIEESMRLLYVALTRAQNQMYIVDTVNEFSEDDEYQTLSETLLLGHKRKIHLLIPASKDTSVIKRIAHTDITDLSLPEVTPSEEFNFSMTAHVDIEPILELAQEKTPLNLDRSHIQAMDYGTQIHELIENLPNRVWNPEDYQHVHPRYLESLLKFNQHEKTQSIYLEHQEFNHELSYIVKYEDDIMNGIMDFVAISDENITLVDFKTDNATKEEIISRYSEQINEYKKALSILYPEHFVQSFIYSFKFNQYIYM